MKVWRTSLLWKFVAKVWSTSCCWKFIAKVCCESYLQDCAHCQVGGGFEYCSGSNANNTTWVVLKYIVIGKFRNRFFQKLKQEISDVCRLTYDYSDYGESILGQRRPQNRVGRRSRAEDFEDN